jgi:3-phenylpropionate/cinnamic acid dioxygenase small subunit
MTLTDRELILDLVNTLFIATDQRDWETVRRLFAPEVLFDMTSLAGGEPAVQPRDVIVGGWENGLRNIRAIHHQVGNYRVRIDRDRADVFCYGTAYHLLPEGEPARLRTFIGSYQFALTRRTEGWLITSFRFDCKIVEPPL